MKNIKILGIIVIASILSLLGVVIPATPALAQPTVTLSPTSGSIGTKVTITAINFESFKNTNVSIFFNGKEIDSSPKTVTDTGSFTADFHVPADTMPGTAQVMVSTVIGGQVTASFTVQGTSIWLQPRDGPVGTMVTLDGSGFYASQVVTFSYYPDTQVVLGAEEATSTGEFSYSFAVPESTAGNHRVVAQDDWGGWAELNFKVIPTVTIEPESGAIGDEVIVTGTGFGNQSRVNIYFNDDRVATSKTDKYGSLELAFDMPITESGTYDVEIEDKDGNKDTAEFTIAAGANLSPTTGNVATTLTVSGVGFKAGGTVTIKYDDTPVATATANASGGFSLNFKAPVSIGGIHSIIITDGDTTITQLFTMESTPPSTPAPLLPEDTDKTKAKIYFAWDDVTDPSGVTYTFQIATDKDFTSIVLEKAELTSADYNLTGAEELQPTVKEAPYYWRVKAIDGASNESEWSTARSFYSEPPPIPALLLPEDGIKAKAEISFDWDDATDPSGVTYTFQIATDKDFTSIVLEKAELTSSKYNITGVEELPPTVKEAPYYWRVKAIDGAFNESEWATARLFYVVSASGFPNWAKITLIVLGILAAAFLAFWMGRRTAYR